METLHENELALDLKDTKLKNKLQHSLQILSNLLVDDCFSSEEGISISNWTNNSEKVEDKINSLSEVKKTSGRLIDQIDLIIKQTTERKEEKTADEWLKEKVKYRVFDKDLNQELNTEKMKNIIKLNENEKNNKCFFKTILFWYK